MFDVYSMFLSISDAVAGPHRRTDVCDWMREFNVSSGERHDESSVEQIVPAQWLLWPLGHPRCGLHRAERVLVQWHRHQQEIGGLGVDLTGMISKPWILPCPELARLQFLDSSQVLPA